jgi:multidrug efflux pump subunit AcrB
VNIAEWSIKKSVITWVMTILMALMGVYSFNNLSRLEDPEFTIKEALIYTPYPGASAAEVEEEVTNVIEEALQELGQLDYVESRSARGLSIIKAFIKKNYTKNDLPQVWDELRRKVNDRQSQLPPGAGPSIVNDDFGDVFGIYVAITNEGYTAREVYEFAKFLQRELLQVEDVKRISIFAHQPEVVYVEMQREKMAEFDIAPQEIYTALAAKNLPAASGYVTLGPEYIPVNPTGEFQSEQEFGDLLIRGRDQDSNRLVYLKDVATISRGYREPPSVLLRYDGRPAIGLSISTVSGGNVVTMGEALNARIQQLKPLFPVGMEGNIIALQSQAVTEAINGFIKNLLAAVVIVIVVLLFFMGLRSGLIIGGVLFITIAGTFIFMDMGNITLERISLGALVIALGMLVDNAIVVTDGMRVKMEQGLDALIAAKQVVGQTAVPLLGATIVAVTAFASIGTSDDPTGEYTISLFFVILISLLLSWVTAVTSTPLLCKTFLKTKPVTEGEAKDPYGGKLFQAYKQFLMLSIQFRWVTIGVVVALFLSAMFGFGFLKNSFFPDSTRPQFYVDFWYPNGTHIDEVSHKMTAIEKFLLEKDDIKHVTTEIGGGQPRFLLTYTPEYLSYEFGRMIVDVDDSRIIPELFVSLQAELEENFPEPIINVRMFVNGPATGGKIQLRISGPDPETLRRLGAEVEEIVFSDPGAKAVRKEWGEKIKVLRPQLAEAQARHAGIDRPDVARAMQYAIEGTTVGVYREKDELLNIVARSPEGERVDLDNLGGIQVWSPAAQTQIPMGQVVTEFKTEFEDPYIWRRNREKMLRYHIDARHELPSELLNRIKPKIEQALNVDLAQYFNRHYAEGEDPFAGFSASTIPIIEQDIIPLKGELGYSMAWGGEAEDSSRAQTALALTLPIFFGLMVLIVLMLFNSIKKTLIIWLTVPLSIIGVTAGLLMFGQPFGFMALLGLMSLSGMLIKNAIVLIDQIDADLAAGKPPFEAIVDSGVSRLIPVAMAAGTTILGMIPLLTDAFFIAMAVTIMFGLGFATILTLIVVPVLYAIFFQVSYQAPILAKDRDSI